MTTQLYPIVALSGISGAACIVSAFIWAAEVIAARKARSWWLRRDPLWIDPLDKFSAGASAKRKAGCSAKVQDPANTDHFGQPSPADPQTGLLF